MPISTFKVLLSATFTISLVRIVLFGIYLYYALVLTKSAGTDAAKDSSASKSIWQVTGITGALSLLIFLVRTDINPSFTILH